MVKQLTYKAHQSPVDNLFSEKMLNQHFEYYENVNLNIFFSPSSPAPAAAPAGAGRARRRMVMAAPAHGVGRRCVG